MNRIIRLIVEYADGQTDEWVGRGNVSITDTIIPAKKVKDEVPIRYVTATLVPDGHGR